MIFIFRDASVPDTHIKLDILQRGELPRAFLLAPLRTLPSSINLAGKQCGELYNKVARPTCRRRQREISLIPEPV